MRQFFKSMQFKIFIFVISACLFGTVISVATADNVSPASVAVGTVFAPIQKITSAVSGKISWFSSSFASSGALKNENQRLKEKIAEYENQLVGYDDMKRKIASYEKMLDVKEANPDFKLENANVIGTDSADVFSSIIIDKGKSDGVDVNDPVISGNYLVGVVKKVNESYSVVRTVLNPKVNVSAADSKTRETGYVTSDISRTEDGKCIFAGLDRTTAVSPGAIIVTSGVGGTYPKGLIIGTVSQVLQSDYDISSYAVVTPGAEIENLEDVFVIKHFKGQGIEEIAGD